MRPLASSALLRLATAASAAALIVLCAAAPVGAAAPANLVRDINPTGSSNPTQLTQVGSTLFFAADDGIHGVELWKSDGTAAGTKMVKNIRALDKSSDPRDLTAVGNTLFFTATDGTHGRELWKSNGTKAGTVMVKDINTHRKNSYAGNGIFIYYQPVAVGNRLFFFIQSGGVLMPTLWVSDGTADGTTWLDAYATTSADEGSRVGYALNNELYFVGSPNSGFTDEIWASDGTTAGTHRMPGSPTVNSISFLPARGQNLYFYTDKLWKTDGTKAGTAPLTNAGALRPHPIRPS